MTISRIATTQTNFIPSQPTTAAAGWNVLTVSGVSSTSVSMSWTAASNAAGYLVANGANRIDVGNVTSYTWSGLTAGTAYTFAVTAYSSSGLYSGFSYATAFTTGFSAATGGTLSTVSNYNGTGQTWNVHRFTSNGTLTVSSAASQFRILLVGGGNNGGGGAGAGGAGGFVYDANVNLTTGANSVVVGGAGTNSTLAALTSASGVRVGTGGNAGGSGGNGTAGAAGTTSNATGSSVVYGGGGGGGGWMTSGCAGGGGGAGGAGGGGGGGGVPGGCNCCTFSPAGAGGAGTANTGGGGGGGGRYDQGCCSGTTTGAGGAGGSGLVVVAYQVS